MKFYGDNEEKCLCGHEKECGLKDELSSLKRIIYFYNDEKEVNMPKRLGLPVFRK